MADVPVRLAAPERVDRTTHLLLVLVLAVQLVSLALDLTTRRPASRWQATCPPANLGSLFPAAPQDPRC